MKKVILSFPFVLLENDFSDAAAKCLAEALKVSADCRMPHNELHMSIYVTSICALSCNSEFCFLSNRMILWSKSLTSVTTASAMQEEKTWVSC